VEENTTAHLVRDIEALRGHLGLERLMVFGGSWGATLALAYAAAHPRRIAAMVLRGVFLGSREEVDWYLGGLGDLVPQARQALGEGTAPELVARFYARVCENDSAAAQRWVAYENALMSMDAGNAPTAGGEEDPATAIARACVQLHYLAHDCFLGPGELLGGLEPIGETPVLIVQGARDRVCPPRAALELAERLPGAKLRLVENGGHSATGPEMAAALRRAADDLRARVEGKA
ncbi:MAG TPA: alpha/beta fold hydrolase, partial [Burkholderiales bacterium]